jgi:serine protease Do
MLLAADIRNDLALLVTGTDRTAVAPFRTRVRVGESVFVYGFPLSDILTVTGNFTVGNVTAVAGTGDDTTTLQISAPVQVGNSAGPVLDKSGHIVGVIVSKLNAVKIVQVKRDLPQNVNFAVKSSIVANFLETNGVQPHTAEAREDLESADIAELAKSYTVRVLCN